MSIRQGVVKPWQSGQSLECQRDLLRHCSDQGIDINQRFCDLEPWAQNFVVEGDLKPGVSLGELEEAGGWYGVKGFFQWLESKTYKMHVRVFLSRYRAYKSCSTCGGTRFQPETLQYRLGTGPEVRGLTLPELNRLPLDQAARFF